MTHPPGCAAAAPLAATLLACSLPQAHAAGELWDHARTVADLGETRAMRAEWADAAPGRALLLQTTAQPSPAYAWCTIPAPDGGWDLATRASVEAEITNRGTRPAHVILWTIPRAGWDAVGAHAELAPGETRLLACQLRETFPDGTPKLDPRRITRFQVMLARATADARLEIRAPRATGTVPPFAPPPDRIEVPDMTDGPHAPGRRTRHRPQGDERPDVYCALHLPENWTPDRLHPIIAEFPGNIFHTRGCHSTGRPEQCVIGYGMARGKDAIWVSLPFVDPKTETVAEDGWGDPDATADYATRVIDEICKRFGGDRANTFLTGFSRGAIACGYIGLRDDRIASLWKGFHACQHYDGDGWRGATMPDALARARRFAGRGIFHTDNSPEFFAPLMKETGAESIFARSGLEAHACAMFLDARPSTLQLRAWFERLHRAR